MDISIYLYILSSAETLCLWIYLYTYIFYLVRKHCVDGYIYISIYLYILSSATSWEEGRQQCLLQGADLAEMNDIEEQEQFTNYINEWRKFFLNILFSEVFITASF